MAIIKSCRTPVVLLYLDHILAGLCEAIYHVKGKTKLELEPQLAAALLFHTIVQKLAGALIEKQCRIIECFVKSTKKKSGRLGPKLYRAASTAVQLDKPKHR